MSLPLSDTLSFNTETFLTWSDRHDMMASFGVTPEKAARTSFRAHRAGGARGDRAVGLDWQYTPQLRFSGGVRVTGLTAAAAKNSPLVEKNVSGGLFMNAMYRF
jgi:outer membrane scaffolding protein for murein synthesis (MipA/OmpV family)